MYGARFELARGRWAVFGGRVRSGTRLPQRLMALFAQGELDHLALRRRYGRAGEATVLVPCADDPRLPSHRAALAGLEADVAWCRSASEFDALHGEIGRCRRWLHGTGFAVRDVPCALDLSWLPDDALFQQARDAVAVVHQINLCRYPTDANAQRVLRKHLARLALLEDAAWPAARVRAQRLLVERRLENPWLVDELIATDDAQGCRVACEALHRRLAAQGGQALFDAAVQPGSFDELFQTGLSSGAFLGDESPWDLVGHSLATTTLWSALAQSAAGGRAITYDAFVSHASPDAESARALCEQIEAQGLRCWMAPRDIGPGEHYADVIDGALRTSAAMVLLLSEAALASPHVLREAERAVHHRASVFPVRLAAVQPGGAFGYLLSGCQWTDALPGRDWVAVARRLAAALADSLQRVVAETAR